MSSIMESLSQEFRLAEREDAYRDLIANAIIEFAQGGIRDTL
jgi:hypothetical protein